MQERRKVDMQMAAEAEAAGKVKASLLRENIRKANQKVLVEAERLKAEGRVTREAASQALLAALRNQTPSGYPMVQSAHCHCAGVSSSPVGNMQHDFRADKTNETACIVQPLEMSRQRMTADDILLRQRFATPLVDMSLGKVSLQRALHAMWSVRLCCCANTTLYELSDRAVSSTAGQTPPYMSCPTVLFVVHGGKCCL